MLKLNKLPMATNKEQLGHLVDRLQHASPEQVEITNLPDGGLVIHLYAIAPRSKPAEGKIGKWAKVAEELANENLLRDGLGDELRKNARQFQENFVLKSPFDTME
jgi:hypothetical protein